LSRTEVISFPLPFVDDLRALAQARMTEGMIVEAQLAAEAASRLQELSATRASGRRAPCPAAHEMIDLPVRLRQRSGLDRAILLRAAGAIEVMDLDIMGLPAAPMPKADLSPRMRAYLAEGVHPGCNSAFDGLAKRGLITRAAWGAPLTDLGQRYVWGHCERLLDRSFSAKQRRHLPILRTPEELSRALISGSTRNFRDYEAIVLPHDASRPAAIVHPYLSREVRSDALTTGTVTQLRPLGDRGTIQKERAA